MSDEEKTVVNSFEGEVSYNETLTNNDFYLLKESDFLLAGV